jgi:AraC family transcriptional regulator, activator of mtrCDE
MDSDTEIFRELALLVRVRPELQQICRFGLQWTSKHNHEPRGWAPFHIVTQGACLVDVGDLSTPLHSGDVAVLPHGQAHTLRALPTATPSVIRVRRRLYDELVIKSNVDGEPDTKIICGHFCFEHAHNNMVLEALPPLVVLSSTKGREQVRLRRIVEAIRDELEEDRFGGAAIAAAIASSLMLMVLTIHFTTERESSGILALLARRQTATVLASMLREPTRAWTLDDLANQGGTSRATLVRLFQKSVHVAPRAFLADLRLNLARHRIRATNMSTAAVAESVGYQSESAFSRAYRRRFAVTPSEDRKNAVGIAADRERGQ